MHPKYNYYITLKEIMDSRYIPVSMTVKVDNLLIPAHSLSNIVLGRPRGTQIPKLSRYIPIKVINILI